jgi:hypothetical protein
MPSLRSAARPISREGLVMIRVSTLATRIHLNLHALIEDYAEFAEEGFMSLQIQRFSHC